MLVQRVVTALVLLPLLLAAIWYLPPTALYAVFCGAGLVAAWEWAGLMVPTSTPLRAGYLVLCAACMATAWLFKDAALWFFVAAALWWLYALGLVARYPGNFERARPGPAAMGVMGLVLLVPTMLALSSLRGMVDGQFRLLYLFFLVFAADTGAFLAGRTFGKRKLAPAVSPGKTLEGFIGGMLLCAAWALIAGTAVFRLDSPTAIGLLVVVSLVVAAFSVVGDLTESLFKRAAGKKDSGSILPGHGGMLDRVDSILAAAPLLTLGLLLTGL
jgi:phosphatidate cytidylyltransferase